MEEIIRLADKYRAPLIKERLKVSLIDRNLATENPWYCFCVAAYLEDVILARMFIANFGPSVMKSQWARSLHMSQELRDCAANVDAMVDPSKIGLDSPIDVPQAWLIGLIRAVAMSRDKTIRHSPNNTDLDWAKVASKFEPMRWSGKRRRSDLDPETTDESEEGDDTGDASDTDPYDSDEYV